VSYGIKHIADVIGARAVINRDIFIEHLLLDSRRVFNAEKSLFFAIRGERRDGHQFIDELYERGVRSFVVSEVQSSPVYKDANFLIVPDTLLALQKLAAWHRSQFDIPVIGITGSNGKTIVKEWLYQLLQPDYNITRSPRSYNSQIGVPLSVWQMNASHTLGIFEAGISRPGEMKSLAAIIQPTIGILTNIGEAHSEGFSSMKEKENEKGILLENTKVPGKLSVIRVENKKTYSEIFVRKSNGEGEVSIEIPFTDEASVSNAITCWELMIMLGYKQEIISQRMKLLQPVNMRLELKKGINHCTIINDSYSADLSSLEIALNFLKQQSPNQRKTVILSDFPGITGSNDLFYQSVMETIHKHGIQRLLAIGEEFSTYLEKNSGSLVPEIRSFPSTEDFIRHFRSTDFKEETILVKGARRFMFEQIVQLLEAKAHQTVLEINLNAIANNLREFQRILRPSVKIMAMVKAFAYGSGGAEIAGILQYHKVDYLGVAYADEGVELRKAGIHLPIMVMNPDESAFESIVENNLEPEIYSFHLLDAFRKFLQRQGIPQYPIHIEIETGMNRLGFPENEIETLADELSSSTLFSVKSVFSHLAASEDPAQDEFTVSQSQIFERAVSVLSKKINYPFIKHLANSAGIIRHPNLQYDMIRLGIGMYGVASAASKKLKLEPVATLKSTIAQVKKLKKGDTVSYNRKGVIEKDTQVGTIRIGYADGYPRRLSYGRGKVLVHGKLAPVIGTVCMDMFMIDLTGIPAVAEGDEVILFGKGLPVEELATWAETIPYEIMTGVSQRVKRVYFEE
jgi:alanine racemase